MLTGAVGVSCDAVVGVGVSCDVTNGDATDGGGSGGGFSACYDE
jgi:hypothetical protein